MGRICALIKNDLDRYSLDYLDIVSCCILRWKEGENCSCACHDTIHLSVEFLSRIGIHLYFSPSAQVLPSPVESLYSWQ